jgi:hypothetical protein
MENGWRWHVPDHPGDPQWFRYPGFAERRTINAPARARDTPVAVNPMAIPPTHLPSCLSMLRLPARLNAEQTAQVLGFQPHDIPVLVKAGLLKPLGGGPRNCVKFFAAVQIEEYSQDTKWLDRATREISRRKSRPPEAEPQ